MNAPGYAGPGEKADSLHRPCASKEGATGQQEAPLGTELPPEELERLKKEQEKQQLPPAGEYEDKPGQ